LKSIKLFETDEAKVLLSRLDYLKTNLNNAGGASAPPPASEPEKKE